nr:hypothetical protein [Tanacetum cinerariifolium]
HVRETITITSTKNTDGIVQVEEVEKKPQVVKDVGEDEDFNSGPWVGATKYVKTNGGMKNMVKVFHKDFVPGNGSGVGGSRMLMEEEEIVKLVEEEEMANLELHVCRNVID